MLDCVLIIQAWAYFPGPYLPWNGPWWLARKNVFSTMWNKLTGEMIFDNLSFTDKEKIRGGRSYHTFSCAIQPQQPSDLPSEYTDNIYLYIYPTTYEG